MTDEDKWRAVWAAWAVAFAVAEFIAIRSGKPRAPLCYQLRRVLGVRRQPLHHRAGQVAYASVAAWLTIHLYREAKDNHEH